MGFGLGGALDSWAEGASCPVWALPAVRPVLLACVLVSGVQTLTEPFLCPRKPKWAASAARTPSRRAWKRTAGRGAEDERAGRRDAGQGRAGNQGKCNFGLDGPCRTDFTEDPQDRRTDGQSDTDRQIHPQTPTDQRGTHAGHNQAKKRRQSNACTPHPTRAQRNQTGSYLPLLLVHFRSLIRKHVLQG